MTDRRTRVFAPLHEEEPPDLLARIMSMEAEGASGGSPYSGGPEPRRPFPVLLVAAAVVVVLCVGGGFALARTGDDPDPTTAADGTAEDVAAGPCPLELVVPGVADFVPVESSTILTPDQLAPLGMLTVIRAEQGGQIIEVFGGAFGPEEFHEAAVAYESGDGGGAGEEVLTAVPITPPSAACATWGILGTGPDYTATSDAVIAVQSELAGR